MYTVKIKTYEEIEADKKTVTNGPDHLDNFWIEHDESKIRYTNYFEDALPESRVIEVEPCEDWMVWYKDGEKHYLDDYLVDDNYNEEG